jgi:protein-S-isoprenylcysteine O-methyltransferase Ste14
MFLNPQTLASAALGLIGLVFAVPVLAKGFGRRGKGVVYEHNFVIQRAPQLASLANIFFMVWGILVSNSILEFEPRWLLSLSGNMEPTIFVVLSWVGVGILASGLVFMIGGWYSLGESFTTDAEVLEGHRIRKTGLLKFVMHPAYSGIIQSLLGSSLAAASPLATLFCLCVVAPLWLNRAKYEEKLMLETFGQEYKDYGDELKWRRLVPKFIPIGV